MLVKDIMHKGIHLISRDLTVSQAVSKMSKLNIGAVLIGSPEKLEGIFSERDLLKRVIAPRLSIDKTPISEVMTDKLLTVKESELVDIVLPHMEKKQLRHLPVIDDKGKCVGMLGSRDLMGAMLNKIESENEIMTDYLLTVSRVALVIIDLAYENGLISENSLPSGEIVIKHKLQKSDLESLTNTNRKTLNKILSSFQDEGLINVSRNKITILDIEKLKKKII